MSLGRTLDEKIRIIASHGDYECIERKIHILLREQRTELQKEIRMELPRVILTGTRNYTEVRVMDGPGQGNASHEYQIYEVENGENLGSIFFQNGPIKEVGVNGMHNEDLIAIVIDRLEGFQSGEYKCRENALALTKLQEAAHWLAHRTAGRQARGVEGTHTV